MRIAVFTESYEPVINGVSVFVATLRDGLKSCGHEVLVFAPKFTGHKDTSKVHRFPSSVSRFAPGYPIPIPFSPKIRDAFDEFRPDVVHTQTPFILGTVGLRWARRFDIPVVSTNHTLYTEYTHYVPVVPQMMTKTAVIQRMKWYYSQCNAVVVPSSPVESVLREYGVETPIEIIKTGVEVSKEDHRERIRHQFGIDEKAFVLLYVGRVAKEKNLSLLLRTFKNVRRKFANAVLMIVGSGPDEDECRSEAWGLGIEDGVIFTGMQSHDEVIRMYGAADAFVFPSVTETQGLSVCEAIRAGLPCIAVRAAATPEVVSDEVDGLLTENTVESFADGIIQMIANPVLRKQLSDGAIKNAERFSPETMTAHFEKFYQSIIDGRKV